MSTPVDLDSSLDPFDPAADPYPLALADVALPTEATTPARGRSQTAAELDRRSATKLIASAIALPLLSSCVPHRLACETLPESATSCRHRHCRYYRGK